MTTSRHQSLTNYIAYRDLQNKRNRVGHYDFYEKTIQPLAFISGTPIDNLYQVIEVGEANLLPSGNPFPASSVKILPPLAERDVLCVGKNYAEHAKEFNNSGFDSSDKVDTPSHPVIFTKRFTSVIAVGEDILSHPEFTQTLDYEGEVGVIIGKSGFRIHEEEAADHVWGYTIINDVTARERQRDHKQFYIGKSADTFCPMVGSAFMTILFVILTLCQGANSGTCFQTRQGAACADACQRRATTGCHNRRSDILNSISHQDNVRRPDFDAWRCACDWYCKSRMILSNTGEKADIAIARWSRYRKEASGLPSSW
jgi:2-keto-4-pentenoate hydratase/2-oxohepta-3-ene-1,7-dioic acid hydratase in catechol pathway